MRSMLGFIGILILLPFSLDAQEKQPPKADYTEFARLVHSMVVKQLPKEFEDTTGWGGTIPVDPNLKLAKLRKTVKVGDKLEWPHGTWRKFKGKLEEPDKNLKIVVKDFKTIDAKTYRFVADVDATFFVHAEVEQWQKGLFLLGGEVAADANVTAAMVCDVKASLDFKKIPPDLVLDTKVAELGLEFVDYKVRGGPVLKGELGDSVRRELKEMLRLAVKASEPTVKTHINEALTRSLKEGKGAISAEAILKALPK